MKHLWIGVCILAVILAASIVCVSMLNLCVHRVADRLDEAVSLLDRGETSAALKTAKRAANLWHRYSGFLCSILDHEESDSIAWNFAELSSYAQTCSTEEFRCRCVEASAMIRHMADMELPYYYNIF